MQFNILDPEMTRPALVNSVAVATRVHASAATVWDLTIKTTLGKLTVPQDLSARLVEQGLAMLSAEDAEELYKFPEHIRHDPFDRLIVAQAQRTGMQSLTADQVLLGLKRDFIVDARR